MLILHFYATVTDSVSLEFHRGKKTPSNMRLCFALVIKQTPLLVFNTSSVCRFIVVSVHVHTQYINIYASINGSGR